MQPNFPDPLTQSCTICLLPILYPYCKLTCNHFYCFECIEEWLKTHENCPLCAIPIKLGYKYTTDSSVTEVLFSKKPAEQHLSLDCLDHSYFKEEISKLLRLCYELEVSRFKQRNSKGTPGEWRALQDVRSRLETLKHENEAFVRFDPEGLLDEVYQMGSDIDKIKNGVYQCEEYREVNQEFSEDSDEYYE